MKTIRNFIQRYARVLMPVLVVAILFSCTPYDSKAEKQVQQETSSTQEEEDTKRNIKIALLLDTSNSMDGLIDQAKSQLWKIVNELAEAKANEEAPNLNIALYEYGNDNLSVRDGYVRQVAPMTTDLDLISEKLFALRTNGGSEYCGKVIQTSLDEIDWADPEKEDLKVIFIAGNEEFTQGPLNFKDACLNAKDKDVVINTIFCGNYQEGINTQWKSGADLTQGEYMNIDQDKKTVFIATPYDDEIDKLNLQLNNTYIYYGSNGRSKKEAQIQQDMNSATYGKSNSVERAISKSKKNVYRNDSWDLVDAAEKNEEIVEEADEETLPEEMKGMSTEERKTFVKEKSQERARIQKEIGQLSKQRQEFIDKEMEKVDNEGSLDNVMLNAVKEQAKTKNFKFEE